MSVSLRSVIHENRTYFPSDPCSAILRKTKTAFSLSLCVTSFLFYNHKAASTAHLFSQLFFVIGMELFLPPLDSAALPALQHNLRFVGNLSPLQWQQERDTQYRNNNSELTEDNTRRTSSAHFLSLDTFLYILKSSSYIFSASSY